MIAAFLVQALLVGVLASVAAVALDRLAVIASARSGRTPRRRFAWAAAMMATVLVPLASLVPSPDRGEAGVVALAAEPAVFLPIAAPDVPMWREAVGVMLGMPVGAALRVADALVATATAGRALLAPLEPVLVVGWALATAVLLAVLVHLAGRLARSRRSWQRDVVDGVPVLLSEETGPAVIGVWRGEIVIPRWLLALAAPLRTLVLRHEREHLRARDPGLLALAVLCLLTQPWNPALWWQLRRLRLAIELDCDARVLSDGADVERYGLLLLAVGQRARRRPLAGVAALVEDRTLLSRRIATMSAPRTRYSLARGALWLALAGAGVAAACAVPGANTIGGPVETSPAPSAQGTPASDDPYFEFQVDKPAALLDVTGFPEYPRELRDAGIEGRVLVQYVVGRDGQVDAGTMRVIASDHEQFTAAVREALPRLRFTPAEVDGRAVEQVVQQPFVFAMGDSPPPPPAVPSRAPSPPAGFRTLPPPPPQAPTSAPPPRAAPPVAPPGAFFEFQVQQPVRLHPDSPMPRYPDALRDAGVQGRVLAQFVVGADGAVEPGSFVVIESDDPQFAEEVRRVLPQMRFTPAELEGRKVRQLVQQPFVFAIQ